MHFLDLVLQEHRKSHFVCDTCGRKFNSKAALTSHEKGHKGASKFLQCEICQKKFLSQYTFRIHMEENHDIKDSPPLKKRPKYEEDSTYTPSHPTPGTSSPKVAAEPKSPPPKEPASPTDTPPNDVDTPPNDVDTPPNDVETPKGTPSAVKDTPSAAKGTPSATKGTPKLALGFKCGDCGSILVSSTGLKKHKRVHCKGTFQLFFHTVFSLYESR